MNAFKTIVAPSYGEYKEKGSRFIGFAFNVETADEVKLRLSEIKSNHPKARHHCFAYRIGFDKMQYRAFDDGEPSGTAGKPILGQIDSFELTNVLIIVVRYFGGVLLGAAGLNGAYKAAARLALEAAQVVEKEITFGFQLRFEATVLPNVMALLKKHKIKSTVPLYDDGYFMEAFIPAALANGLVEQLSKHGVSVQAI